MSRPSIYRPLASSKSEIRLIEYSNTLGSYRLIHSSLGQCPYSALSYVWGDPSVTEDIILDGVSFPVTSNLAAALKHTSTQWARYYPNRELTELRLWADAICINQNDVAEKNDQVQHMDAIYSSAELVVAWLGDKTHEIELAFETYEVIWKEISNLPDNVVANLAWLEKYPQLYEDDLDSSTPTPLKNKRWVATGELFGLSYWNRIWIVQETALARTLLLCTDSSFLQYEKIALVWSRFQMLRTTIQSGATTRPKFLQGSLWEHLSSDFDTWRTIERIEAGKLRARRLAAGPQDLHDIAFGWMMSVTGRSYLATDPKDHIYGLLALTRINIAPDYSQKKPVSEVYREYVQLLLQNYNPQWEDGENHPLFFLYFAGIGIFDNTLDLPSWAPNFPEESQKGLTGFFIHARADNDVFSVSALAPAVCKSILAVDGVELDVISRIEYAPHEDTWFDGSLLAYIKDFTKRNPTYVTGVPPLQAILRALKLDATDIVDEERVFYAYSMLEFILAVDIPNVEANLNDLGIGTGENFNAAFPECVFPGFQTPKRAWWENFCSNTDEARAEFRPELRFAVISNLTWLRKRWRFCETEAGYFGLAPLNSHPGDKICVLNGCGTPVALQKTKDEYRFVGSCFILGLMNGEASHLIDARGLRIQRFEIS
jgi:hypothetical protein